MRSVLLEVRRARQRRLTLVALAAAALALPFLAWVVPRLAPVLAPPSLPSVLLAAGALVVSSASASWAGTEAHWTVADDIAWVFALVAFAVLAALGSTPVTLATLLFGVAAVTLAVRVPPTRLVIVTALACVLGPLLRVAARKGAGAVEPLILVNVLILFAHVTLARATHSLAYVLTEREALLNERRALTRGRDREREPASITARTSRPRLAASALATSSYTSDLHATEAPAPEEIGWDGLVDRLRTTLSSLCEGAGVAASVHAEVKGLAPPSSKMRQNVLKIAQEATHQALRDNAPSTIAITLRRGDGGLLLEVLDDGSATDLGRTRRALATLRGRVAPLGGSAEIKRADTGWLVRVKLPCEQLN